MRDDKNLKSIGLYGTAIYLLALIFGIPAGAYCGVIKLDPLPLNSLGDFLAGAFGPLALFWVVLGFFQQGKELKNSTDALKIQADELRNATEQQMLMAKAAISQLAVSEESHRHNLQTLARKERPNFLAHIPKGQHPSNISTPKEFSERFSLEITNLGADAVEVSWQVSSDFAVRLQHSNSEYEETSGEIGPEGLSKAIRIWKTNQTCCFDIYPVSPPLLPHEFRLHILYTDRNLQDYTITFRFKQKLLAGNRLSTSIISSEIEVFGESERKPKYSYV